MKRFDLNTDFSVDCTIAEKSRSGTIYRVLIRNAAGGKMLTPVALYFAWQPDFVEGYNRHWRVDCFCEPPSIGTRRTNDTGPSINSSFET